MPSPNANDRNKRIDAKTNSVPLSFRVRYIFALTAIACSATLSFFLTEQLLGIQKQDAQLINLAGKQRMLSQRVALLLQTADNSKIDSESRNELLNEVTTLALEMKQSHEYLSKPDSVPLSPQLHALYFQGEPSLDQKVKDYTALAVELAKTTREGSPLSDNKNFIDTEYLKALLTALNKVVEQYEEEAKSKLTKLAQAETSIWLTTLSILFLIFIFIFRPLEINLQTTFARLQKQLALSARLQKKAESAALAKSQFLASMSHEIRTPMNGILGMLGLLLPKELDEETRHKIQIAHSSAQSLLVIINDILDFSKLDANKVNLERIVFDIKQVFAETCSTISLQAHQKNIELILDLSRINNGWVIGDPGRIRQIMTNLASNAIKFTSNGEIIISADLRPHENSQLYRLEFSVKDTGIGIPEKKIKHLFDAFSQVDASTTRKFGGTGLGLSIVKKLITAMNGEIYVSSELDKGSTFKVHIEITKAPHQPETVPHFDLANIRALIVDDNYTNRQVLSQQLSQWGVLCDEADSGYSALDLCEKYAETDKSFDIAIFDMQMPSMDGHQLAQKFKEHPALNKIPLIMMTSLDRTEDLESVAECGFSAYFIKPANPYNLRKAVNVILNRPNLKTNSTHVITDEYVNSLSDSPNNTDTSQYKFPPDTHVLIVEDNHINQELVKYILEDEGVKYTCAANGQDALDILNNKETPDVDLILMDCQMPVLDGFETTKCIRSTQAGEKYVNIPIIATTANALRGDDKLCLAAGMNGYISKPIDSTLLIAKLKNYLAHPSKTKT